jgi:hypothetical protein
VKWRLTVCEHETSDDDVSGRANTAFESYCRRVEQVIEHDFVDQSAPALDAKGRRRTRKADATDAGAGEDDPGRQGMPPFEPVYACPVIGLFVRRTESILTIHDSQSGHEQYAEADASWSCW